MPKNKPTLEEEAWKKIWKKYQRWLYKSYRSRHVHIDAYIAIQRIVNAELRKKTKNDGRT